MNKKKTVMVGVLLLIIVCVILIMLANSMKYEKIEVTPNGTSMDVPANQTRYLGDVDAVKAWKWDDGAVVTYNSREDKGIIKIGGLSFDAMNELVKNADSEDVDGVTCYLLNADELLEIHLFDIIKVNYKGKYYCIPLANETTEDNIMIICNDRDVAVHMAESVEYKNVYPEDASTNSVESTIENLTDDLQSRIHINI